MSTAKKIMYVVLGVLASAVMVALILWGIWQDLTFLIISASLAAVFLVYFFALLYINYRTGWSDEKTARRRVLSDERLLLDVYPHKRGIAADVYLASDAKNTVAMIARIAQNKGSDADMGALSAVYVGYAVIRTEDVATIRNKVLAVGSRAEELPALETLKKHNDVIAY